jgi:type VI secretion system protein ImpE
MSGDSTQRVEAGDLDGAIELLNAEVRQHPGDLTHRAELAELLCFAGELERADRMLDVLAEQDTSLAVGVALFRQLLRAEESRQQFYSSGRLPAFIDTPTAHDQLYLRALVLLKDGDGAGAARLLDEAEAARAPLSGKLDDRPFSDLRDLDDISATHFDVLTSTGKFYWIPMRQVQRVMLHAPRRRRDLLFRRATMEVESGPSGEVFLPTIYPGLDARSAGALRLGQQTDFIGDDATPVRGRGLRSFLVDDEARPILEMASIEFGRAG